MVTGEAYAVLRRQRIGANVIPMRVAVFDADGLTDAPAAGMASASYFDSGVEYGPQGRARAYHFRIADGTPQQRGIRVPASDVVHFMDAEEPGQDRGLSWFTPVVIDLAELAGYQDSTALKQHLASKISFATTDVNAAEDAVNDPIPNLEPGTEIVVSQGRDFHAFQPPLVREYADYVKANRGEIAVALGTTPEALSGDYSGMNWSVARASYVNHWARLRGHRERWLRPGLEEIYDWARWIMGGRSAGWPEVDELEWRMPVMRALDPDREGLADNRIVRNGFASWSDTVAARGHDPDRLMQQIADERARMLGLGIVLDCDPNVVTMQGQAQQNLPSETPGGESDE